MSSNNIKESTRYDRQIRVWGAEAQFRLQNAKVLVINFTNLNIEVKHKLILFYRRHILIDKLELTGDEESSPCRCARNYCRQPHCYR